MQSSQARPIRSEATTPSKPRSIGSQRTVRKTPSRNTLLQEDMIAGPAACEPPYKLDNKTALEPTGEDVHADVDAAFQTPKRTLRPRPSLSERTMDTLARIPPSPALSKKTSSFFEQKRSVSRADSGESRPGSSYQSDGSGRAPSRQGSRPGSRTEDDAARGPNTPFKSNLATIDGTPRRTSAFGAANKTPQGKLASNRPALSSAKPTMPPVPPFSENRSPSPDKRSLIRTPVKSGSQTTLRPAKARASVNGLFKKPSLPALGKTANASGNTGTGGAWDGSIPPADKSRAAGAGSAAPALSTRKSSAALREQIAKAKAAKRAAAKQVAPSQGFSNSSAELPIVPGDDGFKFETEHDEHDDPFNLRRGEQAGTKVLQQRVSAARTSGRLNIAALNLKEIPPEVLKMYDLESIGTNDGSWAESVDLTRLVAADNELERLDDDHFPDTSFDSFQDDDSQGSIFAGLESIDLHGNRLLEVPMGFRRLSLVTTLNLSSNRLQNESLGVLSQMTALRDLRLSKNQLSGCLDAGLASLESLEILDVQSNEITALPANFENMSRLRILNLNDNKLEKLHFGTLTKIPLTELSVRKNKLSGVLIQEFVEALPHLQTLDVSANQLTHVVPEGSSIHLPVAHAVSLSVNRLRCLPDMASWSNLLTLAVDENQITSIPDSFTGLQKLRNADFSGNDIRTVPPEIARMENLTMIRLSGNPMRDRKLVSATTEELKEVLAARLEPPPPYQEPADQATVVSLMSSLPEVDKKLNAAANGAANLGSFDRDLKSDGEDDFATPPTSVPHSRAHSRTQTVAETLWQVKPGGVLDRSRTESSRLDEATCAAVAATQQVRDVQLHHNQFTSLPASLHSFGGTLTFLSLGNNQLAGSSYLAADLELPSLRALNLTSNHITSLEPLARHLRATRLERLEVTHNRLAELPANLMDAFPRLSELLAANNQLTELDPQRIQGLRVVDVSSNDIGQLNARIGLLGGTSGLERLEVTGNRFKVPRWSILEQGTQATLRWLRGRLPADEVAAWQHANGEVDDVD